MKFTRKIIGFRSGKRRNKAVASIGYLVFLIGLLGQSSSAPTAWDSFVHTLAWILLFLFIVIPIANIFSIRKKLFFFNRLSFLGKVFGVLGYTLLALIVCFTVGFGMESATAKQMEAKQQSEQIAKAKAEANAKIKAEQIAKVKAEADAQAKAQADAQAKAEADAQAKAEAEADAQAKAETDVQAKAQADAQAKAQADAQAKAQADAQAKAQADAQAKAQADAQSQQTTVQILSVSNPAPRNSTATLTAKVTPGATAYIAVHYESGDSVAQGLGPKQAEANGNISWSWHVGGRTTLGTVPITVTCNGASADTQFTVIH